MTTTDTMDTKSTVDQTIRMVNSGCEFVRITAPSVGAAKNLSNIKNELRMQGYNVPLIADIISLQKLQKFQLRLWKRLE